MFDSRRALMCLHEQFGEPSYTPLFFDLQAYESVLVANPSDSVTSRSSVNTGVLVPRTARTIAAHCHQLTSLALAGCRSLTDAGLVLLGRSLSRLQVRVHRVVMVDVVMFDYIRVT